MDITYLQIAQNVSTELDFLVQRMNDDWVVVDVGANVGSYTEVFCERVAKCIAFEPSAIAYEILAKRLPMNAAAHRLALSDRFGLSTLSTPIQSAELHSHLASLDKVSVSDFQGLHGLGYGFDLSSEKVVTAPLDEIYFESRLDFLKIDTEGHELQVLIGAARTLTKFRPLVLIEIDPFDGLRSRHSRLLLEALGYEGYFIQDSRLKPLSEFRPNIHQSLSSPDRYVRNAYFRPQT